MIDISGPAGGFAAAGLAGLAAAQTGYLLSRRPPARTRFSARPRADSSTAPAAPAGSSVGRSSFE